MKSLRKVLLTIMIILVAAIASLNSYSVKADTNRMYLGIERTRPSGRYVYGNDNGNVYKISTYTGPKGTTPNQVDNLFYCLDRNKGFGPQGSEGQQSITEYNKVSNLSFTNKNQVLWILDNMYVQVNKNTDEAKEERAKFLNTILQYFNTAEGREVANYEFPLDIADAKTSFNATSGANKLTDDDIDVA